MSRSRRSHQARKAQRQKEQQSRQAQPAVTPAVAPLVEQAKAPANRNPTKQQKSAETDGTFKFLVWERRFTGALVLLAVAQSCIAHWQYGAMSDQNALAKGQLELAQRSIEQTQKTLDIMRLEQRPWLSVALPTVDKFAADKPVPYAVPVRNTGSTPGFIDYAVTGVFRLAPGADPAPIIQSLLSRAPNLARQTVIPPDGIFNFHPQGGGAIPQQAIDSVMSGETILYMFGVFKYHDIAGDQHLTKCCFHFNVEDNTFRAYEKYNEMD